MSFDVQDTFKIELNTLWDDDFLLFLQETGSEIGRIRYRPALQKAFEIIWIFSRDSGLERWSWELKAGVSTELEVLMLSPSQWSEMHASKRIS